MNKFLPYIPMVIIILTFSGCASAIYINRYTELPVKEAVFRKDKPVIVDCEEDNNTWVKDCAQHRSLSWCLNDAVELKICKIFKEQE